MQEEEEKEEGRRRDVDISKVGENQEIVSWELRGNVSQGDKVNCI